MAKLGGLLDFAGRTARAVDQGYDLDNVMYHASKQDIDEFVPGYDDGLVFLTPSKEFANNWLGKGRFQERQGGTGAIEGVKAEIKQFNKEANEILESLPEDQASQYYREVLSPKRQQLYREEREADSAIYPVVTRAKKPFVPSKDFGVLEELFGEERFNAPFGSGFPTYKDALKDGNYLMYENKEVVDFLKTKGYDSMFLKESSGADEPFTTLAVFEPSDIRSVNAQFDPNNKDSSKILSSAAPITAGLLGAGALGSSDEAQAGILTASSGNAMAIPPQDREIQNEIDARRAGGRKYRRDNPPSERLAAEAQSQALPRAAEAGQGFVSGLLSGLDTLAQSAALPDPIAAINNPQAYVDRIDAYQANQQLPPTQNPNSMMSTPVMRGLLDQQYMADPAERAAFRAPFEVFGGLLAPGI